MNPAEELKKIAADLLETKNAATLKEIKLEGLDNAEEYLNTLNEHVNKPTGVFAEYPSLIADSLWGSDLADDIDISSHWLAIIRAIQTLESELPKFIKSIAIKREEIKQMPETTT